MQPEDRLAERLDALLAARRAARRSPATDGAEAAAHATPPPDADEGEALDAAFAAAGKLDPVRAAQPRADFTQALEQRLLEQTATLREAREHEASGIVALDTARAGRTAGRGGDGRSARRLGRGRWGALQALAAAVILAVVGGGALAATASSAAPGSPLYGLRRWEQDLRAGFGTSPSDQVRIHLQYANEALDALNTAVAQHAGTDTYRAAMTTALDEAAAASAALTGVATGDQRTSLAAQIATLQQREHSEVHASLPKVDWPSKLYFTTTLGQLGETTPVIASAQVTRNGGSSGSGGSGSGGSGSGGGGTYTWIVELTGTGFQAGAICVVDGQPIGTTLSVTQTQMVVEWPGTATPTGAEFGMQNPDGTAAQTANVQNSDDSGHDGGTATTTGDDGHHGGSGSSSGTPTQTPNGDDGHGGSGGKGGNGSGQSTPTTTPSSGGGGGGSGDGRGH